MRRTASVASILLGILLVAGGVATWVVVSSTLADQKITTSDDACLPGRTVADPFTAYCQAKVIEKHTLEQTDGLTYAELDREDPAADGLDLLIPPGIVVHFGSGLRRGGDGVRHGNPVPADRTRHQGRPGTDCQDSPRTWDLPTGSVRTRVPAELQAAARSSSRSRWRWLRVSDGRPFEFDAGLGVATELLQKVPTHARQQVIGLQRGLASQRVDQFEAGGRPECHRHRHRPVQLDYRRRRRSGQHAVKLGDPLPIGFVG